MMDKEEKEFNDKVKQMDTPEKFLEELSFKIKLEDLYKVERISNVT